jgi:hypothetical protein
MSLPSGMPDLYYVAFCAPSIYPMGWGVYRMGDASHWLERYPTRDEAQARVDQLNQEAAAEFMQDVARRVLFRH